MSDNDVLPKSFSAPHRLEGSKSEVGGLVVKKKKTDDEIFAKPSLLGLQKLAEEKRKINAERDRKKTQNNKFTD